jgi:hypothetical protein
MTKIKTMLEQLEYDIDNWEQRLDEMRHKTHSYYQLYKDGMEDISKLMTKIENAKLCIALLKMED